MKTLAYAFPRVASPSPQSTTIQTTLYDLIETLAAEVKPGEDALVTAVAVHLLRAHRARFIGKRMQGQAYCEKTNYLRSVSA
jgi:hypothetical protein